MTVAAARGELSIRRPIVVSAGVHLVALAMLVVGGGSHLAPAPPVYRVSLIAAPAGSRAIGEVAPQAAPAATAPAATPAAPSAPPKAMQKAIPKVAPAPSRLPAPSAPPARGTAPRAPRPAPAARAAGAPGASPTAQAVLAATGPAAGGGPTGGRGADVANVHVDGIAFPYPGYLDNVVRQIALRFTPRSGSSLTAVVAFLIRRDGSVTGMRLTTRSGVYAFDTEAMGAVDAAAQARAFGPLPQGFSDDVLPVIFSFDPRLIR